MNRAGLRLLAATGSAAASMIVLAGPALAATGTASSVAASRTAVSSVGAGAVVNAPLVAKIGTGFGPLRTTTPYTGS